MDAQRWFILAVLVVFVAIIVYRQFAQTRDQQEQDRRDDIQTRRQASSPAADISEREERRLAGMTDDDRAWEQAILQRQRDARGPARQAEAAHSEVPR